jgi:DNA-binding HxlR family transcriptional regulator
VGRIDLSKSVEADREIHDSCQVLHTTWNEMTRTWTLPTIHALGQREPARFNELKRRIHGISATSLAERLAQLEKFGVLQRKVIAEEHPRIEYSLTAKGHELYEILCNLAHWSQRWEGKEPNAKGVMVPQ